jgi:folate-binding protein YgfZ
MFPMNLDLYHRVLAGETLTFALSPRALWRLTGPDRVRYLNGQVTNDVADLTDGQTCYAAVCTAKGRMEGDLYITAHDAEFCLDADAALLESLGARLEKYLIADDAAFEDISNQWSLSHVFGVTAPPPPPVGFVVPNPRFGIPGHDVWNATSGTVIVGDTLSADIVETLRLEHGIPRWGAELTPNTLPPEAGPRLLAAISYTKGCYVGQETIARLKSVGHVNKTLVFLQSESAAFPAPGAKLIYDEKEVGTVTSSGYSPRLEKGIALAYVQIKAAETGISLAADGIGLTVSTPLSNSAKS